MYIFFWYLFASYILNIVILRIFAKEEDVSDSEKEQVAWFLFKLWLMSPITILVTGFGIIIFYIDRLITNNMNNIRGIKNMFNRLLIAIFGV